MVVKTQEEEGLISNLAETFDNLRKFKMKLNAEKCTFGVPSRKLLGYMVFRHGIDPDDTTNICSDWGSSSCTDPGDWIRPCVES
jgi:hypothetical protein